jgi:hypothetical protein
MTMLTPARPKDEVDPLADLRDIAAVYLQTYPDGRDAMRAFAGGDAVHADKLYGEVQRALYLVLCNAGAPDDRQRFEAGLRKLDRWAREEAERLRQLDRVRAGAYFAATAGAPLDRILAVAEEAWTKGARGRPRLERSG